MLPRSVYSTAVNKVSLTGSVKADGNREDLDGRRSSFSWTLPQFSDHRVIYSSKTNAELIRAFLVFTACSYDFMIDNHAKVSAISAQSVLCSLLKSPRCIRPNSTLIYCRISRTFIVDNHQSLWSTVWSMNNLGTSDYILDANAFCASDSLTHCTIE